jgi:hypothetical protein
VTGTPGGRDAHGATDPERGDADPHDTARDPAGFGESLDALDGLPEARVALRPTLIASTKTMLAEPGTLRTVRSLVQPAREVALSDEQARLNELVAAQLVEWLLLARDRYPALERRHAAQRGLAFAGQLPTAGRAAARDLRGLLGVGPGVPPSRLTRHADGAAIPGLWALVCGLVDSLGHGDTALLRQLTPDPSEQG